MTSNLPKLPQPKRCIGSRRLSRLRRLLKVPPRRSLSRSCRTQPCPPSNPPSTRSPIPVLSNNARTLEDLVKEMLRPMLKSWLDDNLPGLVERIVKAEIERVSRGR